MANLNTVLTGMVLDRIARDGGFRSRLLADPAKALKELGVDLPPGMQVRIVEDSAASLNLALAGQGEGELADEDLQKIVAGAAYSLKISNQSKDASPYGAFQPPE
jgi:hypothetical protein